MLSPQIIMQAKTYWKEILILLLVVGLLGFYMYHKNVTHEAEMQKATLMTEKQMQNVNALQNKLDISKQNAEAMKKMFTDAQTGKIQPNTTFVVQAPSLPQAAQQVQERINMRDTTLPPAALEKTDRTTVVPQPENKDYNIGVYKFDLYRNWEWSAGYGQHDGQSYIPVELQRNFSRDHAVSAEVHLENTGKVNGYEVKYTVKTDRLFFLF